MDTESVMAGGNPLQPALHPSEGPPGFTGAAEVYRLIGALYQRPRFGDWPRKLTATNTSTYWTGRVPRDERSERRGLPMLCLVQPAGPDIVAAAVNRLLNNAKRAGVPHAYVRAGDNGDQPGQAGSARFRGHPWQAGSLSKADVVMIRDLLGNARNSLISSSNARGRRLRFPLFSLVYTLMDSTLDPDDSDPDSTVRQLLSEQGLMRRLRTVAETIDREVAGDRLWWRIPLWSVFVAAAGLFRMVLTGRVPLLSGRYRWFMRQPHLAPEMSGTFVRFAERLIGWQGEAPEYVARLLVNAFLEDLRRGYRLAPWNVVNSRRMTYSVLLLDTEAMRAGGDRLLYLINEVRNQTGLFDPLLIIASSRAMPLDPRRTAAVQPHIDPAAGAAQAYLEWQDHLLKYRRERRDITWYLPIHIPPPRDEPGIRFEFAPDPADVHPPWVSNRWVRIVGVLILVVAAAGHAFDWRSGHCGSWNDQVHTSGSECIGVSDGGFSLFDPPDSTTLQVEQVIAAQNVRAEQAHKNFPRRPYITIPVLQALTSADGTADGLTAARESLEGVAVAQLQQLEKSGDADPIVRVLIANGGKEMRKAATVARQLGDLARRDGSLIGVVGLEMSSRQTADAVRELSRAGLPMVSSTLSDPSIAEGHPMYFQIAPTNKTEAVVTAAFADNHATNENIPRTVRIFHSDDPSDTYSSGLSGDVKKAFTDRGFTATVHSFPAGKANAAGLESCGYNGFVFFAGRGVPDFGDFLASAAQCSSKAVFIGDDDVSRYAAAAPKRQANRSIDFYYVSFAVVPPIKERSGPERSFYERLDSLFPFETDPEHGRSPDGRAAMAYDATQVLITATSYLRTGAIEHPVTPGTVWREITSIHNPTTGVHRQIDGVSGTIDYGGDVTQQVPLNKPVAILQVVQGEVSPDIVGICGNTRHPESSWCP
jgi:ABC-type branched-subunit amino acid transport system substrate-binding protein